MIETKTTTVRLPMSLIEALTQAAESNDNSLNKEIELRLTASIEADHPIVLAWFKADRWGEIDDRDEPDDAYGVCSCGQDIITTNAWFALMSSGKMIGPYCAGCAVSE